MIDFKKNYFISNKRSLGGFMFFRFLKSFSFLCLFFSLGFTSTAFAGTKTQNISTSSTVNNSCKINSTDNITLGNYNPSSAMGLEGTGAIHLICTKGTTVSALPSSGGVTLSGGAGSLNYHLYTNSSLSTIWGSTTYTYITYDFSSSTNVASDNITNTTFAQCQSYAQGAAFYWTTTNVCTLNLGAPNGTCYHSSPTTSCYIASGAINTVSLISLSSSGTQTLLRAGNTCTSCAVYIPQSKSTLVSGYTYTIPNTVSGTGQSISGVSSNVQNPVVLTYYASIPGSQDIPPGTYLDTVTVQVNF